MLYFYFLVKTISIDSSFWRQKNVILKDLIVKILSQFIKFSDLVAMYSTFENPQARNRTGNVIFTLWKVCNMYYYGYY